MAGRIRDEDLRIVRERSPVDEVIGEYIQLRNAGGGSLKGLCPFHDEKSPSFNVTPARGLWYCFGCSEGGDVISFVQKIDHVSFTDAVEHLAARAGVQLQYEEGGYVPGRDRSERTRLVAANRAAAEFYAEQLATPAAEIGRRFLAERGFERADAERFGVGYAPAEWEALVRHLRGRGFTDQELVRSGLAKEGRRGPMDRFRGRLMWPIRELSGDVIAFGARRLAENDDGPKYLNTPETPLFHKGSVLYGADLAKKEIARGRQAVIVEGYTDVMACHLAGVPTAVATCGTSFGDDHIKILRRLLMDSGELRGEVIFTFDGDSAGQRAALRAFADEQKFVTQTFVAVQRDGLDPCDLRIKQGDAAVRDLVASRTPLFEFAVREVMSRYDLDTAEGQIAALDAAAPIVASIKDRGIRQRYAVNLDRWLGIMDERFVLRRISDHAKRRAQGEAGDRTRPAREGERPRAAPEGGGAPQKPPEPQVHPVVAQVEGELLKLAIQRPGLAGPAFDAVPPTAYSHPPHIAIRTLIAECGGVTAAAGNWVDVLRDRATDEPVRDLVTRYAVEPSRTDGEPGERYAASLLARLREIPLSRELASAKGALQRLNPVDNPDEYNAQFARLIALEQELRAVREQGIGAL
ncbi:MAG TPA: DNA primase [Streptosporangiaceae bacterium]|jgi:DNA primase